MTAHPGPRQLADYLHRLADKLSFSGGRALEMAELLAGRGYPTSTVGNGSRSSDTTSSTERAATVGAPDKPSEGEQWHTDEWADVPRRASVALRLLWRAALAVEGVIDRTLAHGSTNDQLPPGTGECTCGQPCGPDGKTATFCAPRQNGPSDRLVSGLAPTCYRRFARWRETHTDGTVAEWKHATRRAREIADERKRQLAASRANLRAS